MTSIAITRRAMLRGAGVVLVGGIVGFALGRGSPKGASAAANGYGYSPPKSPGSSLGQRLVALAIVPIGGGVILGGPRVVVTRDAGGAVHGFSATCTHQGCTVSSVRNGVIECPCHGSRFDANTGQVVRGPSQAPLPAVALTVDAGIVYAH
jgi:Rieske Fe-S protein